MNLLAIETSTELCSVALLRDDELFVEEVLAQNRHSEVLMPMIRRVFERSHLGARQMHAFAFGQGPGSFTGIRIACGVVQGLAFGADRPVVPVPSLLALAEQANASRVVAALDARMGEAYVAAYARNGDDWDAILAPRLVDANGVPELPGPRWVGSGSGFERHAWLRDAWRDSIDTRVEGDLPRASAIARIGVRRYARGDAVRAEEASPLYLRDKVALTTQERQARQ